jgi:hypothetical protein
MPVAAQETISLPQIAGRSKASLGRFRDARLDKRGVGFSTRSSNASAFVCASWPPATEPPRWRSARSSPIPR